MPGVYHWKTYKEAIALREEYYSQQEFEDVAAYVRAQNEGKGKAPEDDDNEIKVSLNDALTGPLDDHPAMLLHEGKSREPLNIRPPHGSLRTLLYGAKTYDELERRWIKHARIFDKAHEDPEPVIKDDRGHRIYQATKDRKPFDEWRGRTRSFVKRSTKFADGS